MKVSRGISFSIVVLSSTLNLFPIYGQPNIKQQQEQVNRYYEQRLKLSKQDKNAILLAVRQFWFRSNSRQSIFSWPYATIKVGGSGAWPTAAYRNKQDYDLQNKQQIEEEEKNRREIERGKLTNGTIIESVSPRLTHMKVTKMSEGTAYVTYDAYFVTQTKPAHRIPGTYPLIAVLRKEIKGWRLVFNAVP